MDFQVILEIHKQLIPLTHLLNYQIISFFRGYPIAKLVNSFIRSDRTIIMMHENPKMMEMMKEKMKEHQLKIEKQ